MLKVRTQLLITDNSGGKKAKCIRILGGHKRTPAKIKNIIIITIKKAIPRTRTKKGEVRKAIVLRTKDPVTRKDGLQIKFDRSSIALLNAQLLPLGSRIRGPIFREFRIKKNGRSFSLGKRLI